jgi:hypothetical protein
MFWILKGIAGVSVVFQLRNSIIIEGDAITTTRNYVSLVIQFIKVSLHCIQSWGKECREFLLLEIDTIEVSAVTQQTDMACLGS